MFKKILLLLSYVVAVTRASDCVVETIQEEITIPSSNQLPFEIYSSLPGTIVFKKHFNDTARNVVRITGQISRQSGRDIAFTAQSVESVQAYTIQLNYQGTDFYAKSSASLKHVGSPLTIGAVATGLCVTTNQHDAVSCAVLGGLISLPFASAECEGQAELTIEVHESMNLRMRSNDQSEAEIVRCPGIACVDASDENCMDGDASQCFSDEINFPYEVQSQRDRHTALPSSRAGRLLHLVKNAGTDSEIVVGRSYEANEWEGLVPEPATFVCSNGCQVSPTVDETYVVRAIEYDVSSISQDEISSRFLLQSTMGPTNATILKLRKMDIDDWIQTEMRRDWTSLREYVRERMNPRDYGAGALRKQCEIGSRWNRYAFDKKDQGNLLNVTFESGTYRFYVGGVLRTETTDFPTQNNGGTPLTFPAQFTFGLVYEDLERNVRLCTSSGDCTNSLRVNFNNPVVSFTQHDSDLTHVFTTSDASFQSLSYKPSVIFLETLTDPSSCETKGTPSDAFLLYDGEYYRHDARIKLIRNTVGEPANIESIGTSQCPSVQKNFLNKDGCARRDGCAPLEFTSVPVSLDDSTLRFWYEKDHRYTYYIKDLRLTEPGDEQSPCVINKGTSRWFRDRSGPCTDASTDIDAETVTTLTDLLSASTDTNEYIRDIHVTSETCIASDASVNAKLTVNGECYTHTHYQNYQVFDFTYWAETHDGNREAKINNRPNPIKRWAVDGLTYLGFPDWHDMNNWYSRWNRWRMPDVGRYGDTMDFTALNTELQTYDLAEEVGAIATRNSDTFEVCGSPSEAENDPFHGHLYHFVQPGQASIYEKMTDVNMRRKEAATTAWTTNAVTDNTSQLRQRIAWALSQILVASTKSIGRDEYTEMWTNYHDIFLTHAFGNYRDVLKEVTYSPVMADYLTYRQNKAFAYQGAFPDENYAREIMQLFSIGLWKLNADGTRMRDENTNELIPTYDNDDVVVYARVFTAFDRAPSRSNTESPGGITTANLYDPLVLKPIWKDNNPKTKLESGYLGDTYPVCDERDPRHFLKKGARYEYTGKASALTEAVDTYLYVTRKTEVFDNLNGRFAPDPSSSSLFQALCAAPSNGAACTFPMEVTLSQNLPCDGKECDAQAVLDVQIFDAVANVTRYYVYRPEPCVRLSFFENGRITQFNHRNSKDRQCTDPRTPAAGAACCTKSNGAWALNWGDQCNFIGDYMVAEEADLRCSQQGTGNYETCSATEFSAQTWWSKSCLEGQFFWTQENCTNKVQIWESGLVSLVDQNTTFNSAFGIDSQNYFRVWWDRKNYPSPDVNNCGDGCEIHSNVLGETCLCDFTVTEDLVFTSVPSDASDVISQAFSGSPHPESLSSISTYERVEISPDLAIWFANGNNNYDSNTVFEVKASHVRRTDVETVYLSNKVSHVNLGGNRGFRNPPTFMPNLGENLQVKYKTTSADHRIPEAAHEVEALLDHLFYHDNTAPFVVYRMIQRLVTSNPSPRYVTECVNAFRTGKYYGVTYSGEYGDLGATVAAILLDREARSTILDSDHTFGRLREPWLKFIHFMRAMEYEKRPGREISTTSMDSELGQQPFKSETVFSYFLPEYQPDGPVANSGLVSPEALVGTAPYMINYLNGMTSLINQGLTACGNGFGDSSVNYDGCGASWPRTNQLGFLRFTPSNSTDVNGVIDEMATLLTPCRLESSNRDMLVREYQAELVSGDATSALKRVQKIFMSLPEFHSVTLPREDTTNPRVEPPEIESQNRPYKAIVVIFEAGGADSYSLLVPYDQCQNVGDVDMHQHYKDIRGLAALEKSRLLAIDAEAGSQVCDRFGIHNALPFVRDLYNGDEALFFTNIGGLVEPITRDEWYDPSSNKELPPQPFAHNIAQRTMHNLEAQNANAKGVLGRTIDAMTSQSAPFKCDVYSIAGNEKMVEGQTAPVIVDQNKGITTFSEFDDMEEQFQNMTKNNLESVFASTYQSLLDRSLKRSNELGELLSAITLDTDSDWADDSLSNQFRQVSKLIKMRGDLGTERGVFLTKSNGWDTHNNFDLSPLFTPINDALETFKAEMEAQGLWDDVVVLTVSDFGRTLTSNGLGTDHAWGGNHFMAGGSVKGGRILGDYPDNLGPEGSLNVGRGRLIPTLSWEAMWNGVVEWFGVESSQMSTVLPNVGNFASNQLFSKSDLFEA